MLSSENINIYGLVKESIVDGPGIRFSIFVQGCSNHCLGCHNPGSQSFDENMIMTIDDIIAAIPNNPLVTGISISGGEPFEQPESILLLVRKIRSLEKYNIWIWSGKTFESLLDDDNENAELNKEILSLCDVLVDGPFIEALYSPDLIWRGSSNQRLIDLHQTFKNDEIVLYKEKPR